MTVALVAAALGAAAPAQATPAGVDFATADRCDPIDPANCLYPFPNDHFTVRDRHTATGRRVSLDPASVPTNAGGVPIAPSDYSYSDGFSPGAIIVTKVPGPRHARGLRAAGAVPITDLARTYDRYAPVVVINARTLRRQLIWAELDSQATSPASTALLIHPAKNLREGERYIVALRRLRDADGKLLEPSPAFKLYRDRIWTHSRSFEARRRHMESIFKSLAQGRHRPPRPLPRVGLHGRELEEPLGPAAGDPRRRLRPAGRPQARRPARERCARPASRSTRSPTSRPAATTAARRARTT